jgi:predicted lipoprotein with Yx(FWY)xxD motif
MQRHRLPALIIGAAIVAATALVVGAALATTTTTLQVAKSAKVKNASGATTTENVVVNSRGRVVYYLTGESTSHAECTMSNSCYHYWPPVTVTSTSKFHAGSGVKGKVTFWHRNGFWQVVLAGKPLYTYAGDTQSHMATGQGAKTFGGTWYVVKAAGASSGGGSGGGGGGWG